MKKALMKDTVKEIKNTHRRFISILLMAFLGVGFFAGLRASSPDMLKTIDKYYKEEQVYDVEVVSTLGLTNDDVEALKKIENVEEVYGTYTQDAIIKVEDEETVAKVMCQEDINKPKLIEGRLPQTETECVVEPLFLKACNKKIGDSITVDIEDQSNDEGEKIAYMKEKNLKIVGTVNSPLFISRDKGSSKLGAGKVNYYIYINSKNVNAKDIYTEIYIKVKNSEKYTTSKQEYEDYISHVKEKIEEIKSEREVARHEMLVEKATKKLDEAQETFDKEKQDADNKIAEARKEIDDGKANITKGENEIAKNKEKADKEFNTAQKQLNSAKKQIQEGEKELQAKDNEAKSQLEQANQNKAKCQSDLNNVNSALKQIDVNYNQTIETLKNPNLPSEQRNVIEKNKTEIEEKRKELEDNKKQLENAISQIDHGASTAKTEIEKAKNELQTSKKTLEAQEKKLQEEKKKAYAKIESAKREINDAKSKIAEGEAELEQNMQEYNQKISDAEKELIDARAKIADIENATWYILDRNSNQGYTGYINDTKSIESLGAVFPIVFFVIATLISLTSMTRMVEEERTQIGTLKALGYSKLQIASKYIIYASLASLIGGSVGMVVGCAFLPRVVWMMYSMMYQITEFVVEFNVLYSGIGLTSAFICIVGATIYATNKELKGTPAILMRPKAPKNGKRVLLERIPLIWNHLSFTRKVTVRNIFRYKKRFLMTVIGILGCTSLILVGFGLRDSISALLPSQFGKVFKYDMQVSLKSNLEDEQKDNLIQRLISEGKIEDVIEANVSAGDVDSGKNNHEVQIIVPYKNEELKKVINLADNETKEEITINENEIAITEKLAKLTGLKAGDSIKIKDNDDREREFKISDIVENYVGHYVYMSKSLYEESFEKEYETNVLYLRNQSMAQSDEDLLVKEISDNNEVSAVTPISTIMSSIDNMMSSLNYVVIILIVSAGILAFVVLYNLSNVNISERIRELSTIKVLGFYDKEVYDYISRETVILTVIGIVLGCVRTVIS